jgi:hypothetical protein
MSIPDYDIHLDRGQFNSLFEMDDESGFPFEEDMEEIERAIAEELGAPKPRRKRKKVKK